MSHCCEDIQDCGDFIVFEVPTVLNVLTAMAHIMQHLGPHSWVPIVEQKEVSPHS